MEYDKLTVEDTINSFSSEGMDIKRYAEQIKVAPSGERAISTTDKPILATTFTFSCTNVLFYNDDFSYLVHLTPSQTVGKKDFFENNINEIKDIMSSTENGNFLNVLVSLGCSSDAKQNTKFHDLKYIKEQLKDLSSFASDSNFEINLLPVMRSKYLLYDYRDKTILLKAMENFNNIEELEKQGNLISRQKIKKTIR